MSATRWAISSIAILWLFATASAEPLSAAQSCKAPEEMTRLAVTLPNTARAMRSGKELVIIAIGSSSTKGVGASDPAHTYPAQLAVDLRHHWPELPLTVVNKGVGGEIASQMLARFERDVLPYHPQLVIWQTGSNQALKSGNIKEFVATIRGGISRLKAAHVDVILMDPQYAPRLLARPLHLFIVDTISAVANEMDVAVFRRFAVMRDWIWSGRYKMEDIISSDGLHMNDASYGCIAHLLADSLVAATESPSVARLPSEGRADARR
ncbi:MAG TPA: SGNH/GDSL hydrolase family protein [Candidatus Binatia bacterium]